MAAGDIFKKRLKVDTSSIDNTIAMIAWDTYSEDRAFDDIYIDDFTDATGIDGTVGGDTVLTGNSDGLYDSANSLFKSGALVGQTIDYTSTQIDCSAWSDINSVAITQTTPGDFTVSAIYHAVSFDNAVTYKVFKTTWLTVAYNNGGTWQYNNAGSLANASTNSLAGAMAQSTAQSAYQWTKTNIEAMGDADWNASGGWSTSVTTVDWTKRLVDGATISGSAASVATPDMTAASSPSGAVSASAAASSFEAWRAFNQANASATDSWHAESGTGWIQYAWDSGTTKIINKYTIRSRQDSAAHSPKTWVLQGSNDGTNWSVNLDSQTNVTTLNTVDTLWTSSQLANTTAYRYYRITVSASISGIGISIGEIGFYDAATSTATPTFTKATINYDTDHIPLSLISNSWEASVNDPVDAYCVLDVEPVDSITLNTDLLAYVSIDNGAHYEQITLEAAPFREIGAHDYVRGDLSGITARTDKTIRIKVTTANSKALKLHAWAIGVKY